MSDPFKTHGAFSWCELLTSDPDTAAEFYSKLFGWQAQPGPVEGVEYTVIKVGEQSIGGIMKMPPEAGSLPPCWGAYVTVDDIDAVVETAKSLGGQILVGPRDIPEVGRFAVIQDPQGAVISAISYVS